MTSYLRRRRGEPRLGVGLLSRLAQVAPVAAVVDAGLGFDRRFDAHVARLCVRPGHAVSPTAARVRFGPALDLELDPRRLVCRLPEQVLDAGVARRLDGAFLDAGDWSQALHPVTDAAVHGEILALCRKPGDPSRLGRYRRLAERIAAGETVVRSGRRLDSLAALDAYFAYYRALIDGVARDGLRRRADHRLRAGNRPPWRDWVERDVGVAVTADGECVHFGPGRHRLAVALGLGLDRIPVEVRLVHPAWLAGEATKCGARPSAALGPALRDLSRG